MKLKNEEQELKVTLEELKEREIQHRLRETMQVEYMQEAQWRIRHQKYIISSLRKILVSKQGWRTKHKSQKK